MFSSVTLHGGTASLLWGYRTVAVLTSWRIAKAGGQWRLSATLTRADSWQCGQAVKLKELFFEAPRDKGRWAWGVEQIDVGTNQLRATLGPPEQ